jgi:hypothetical protein
MHAPVPRQPLTDLDVDSLSVEGVRAFMAEAEAKGTRAGVVTLRAREGLSLNLLRMLGARCARFAPTPPGSVTWAQLAAHAKCAHACSGSKVCLHSCCRPCC